MIMNTLRGKFSVVYIGLALLAILVGLFGIWNLYRLERSVDDLMTANYKSIDAVSHMMESIERQDSGMLISIGIDRDRGVEIFTTYGIEFLSWFAIEQGNVTESGELDTIRRLGQDYAQYQKEMFALQGSIDEGEDRAQAYYTDTILPLLGRIKAECRELISINEKAMFTSKQMTADDAKRSMLTLGLISLAAVIGGLIAARYFMIRFLRPIKLLSDSINRVGEGDLNQQVVVRANDETGMLAGAFNNMTARLQNYEQSNLGTLMAEKKKSMAIVRSISDPLIVMDADWRILLINDACGRFFGLDEKGVAGRHFLEAIQNGELFRTIEQLASKDADAGGKIVSIQKDEEYFFNLNVTKVNEPDSRNTGIIAAFQNVTGLKEIERVKTDFLAAISHEFKTPLTSILMAASMLAEGGLGKLNADQAEALDTINGDGERLLGLVNELLELIKIESGSDVYHPTRCNVNDIAALSVRDHQERARSRGVRIVSRLAPDLPPVDVDFEKIRWVINNLISNALKYTGTGDAITVSTERTGGSVSVSVRDTGAGIPEEFQERIFDKFVQVKGGGIEVNGTGLGLSVSREIVLGHGGDIKVASETGRGSVFTFTIPLEDQEVSG